MGELTPFVSGDGDDRNTLVVVFLRGGADGLNMVAPVEDDGYYKARPRIAIKKNPEGKLDEFFCLNPLLRELGPIYRSGDLAIIHAAGSEDSTRSHFEAQDFMEHGGMVAGGWLGRFLRSQSKVVHGPLSAVALGQALPECLRGAPAASSMESIEDFGLGRGAARLASALERLYGHEQNALGHAGRDTLAAMRRIEQLQSTAYRPEHGAEYEGGRFAKGLMQIARLIKARVGLSAAAIDLDGWDSHTSQGLIMDPLMVRLAKGLAAFHQDLGKEMASTTVVVMTEFGRRLAENSAFGTDHGRGSIMLVLGGGVRGGRVLGKWPGLNNEVLDGPGDLPVTTNYRSALMPVLKRHAPDADLEQVFPKSQFEELPLYS